MEHQPVATPLIRPSPGWGFVPGAIDEAEQLAVELRQGTGVCRIQDHLVKHRERLAAIHEPTSENPRAVVPTISKSAAPRTTSWTATTASRPRWTLASLPSTRA